MSSYDKGLIIGAIIGVSLMAFVSTCRIVLTGVILSKDDKIRVESIKYRVSDIKVIDKKNIVLNVYEL